MTLFAFIPSMSSQRVVWMVLENPQKTNRKCSGSFLENNQIFIGECQKYIRDLSENHKVII